MDAKTAPQGVTIAREFTTIGTFKKTGSNEFTGEIVTLSVQAKNVRIVPEATRSGDNSPSHRVYVGRVDYAELSVMRSGVL